MAVYQFPPREEPPEPPLSVTPGQIYTGGFAATIPNASTYYLQSCSLPGGYYTIGVPASVDVTVYAYDVNGSLLTSAVTQSGYALARLSDVATSLVLEANTGSNVDVLIERAGQSFDTSASTSATVDTITTTSTYNVPAGSGAIAFLVGGGGGGSPLSSGGGSGYAAFTGLSCGASYAVVIGAGAPAANNGGTTSINGVSAPGGFTGPGAVGGAGGSGGGGGGGSSPGLGGAGGTNGSPGSGGTAGGGGAGSGFAVRGFTVGVGGAGGVTGGGGGIYAGGGGTRSPLGGSAGATGGGGGGGKAAGGPGAVYVLRW